jgi:hypothetical protein
VLVGEPEQSVVQLALTLGEQSSFTTRVGFRIDSISRRSGDPRFERLIGSR